jgi:hypothetical protein
MHFDTNIGRLKTQKLQLGNKWLLSGDGDAEANDEWLRLKNAGKPRDYYGGFAAWKFWCRNSRWESDLQLKKGIKVLKDSLNKLIELQGVSFKWNDSRPNTFDQFGLIAQEVEAVFPEIVGTGPDGMKGVDYIALIAPIIEAIKQQHQQIQKIRHDLRRIRERSSVS